MSVSGDEAIPERIAALTSDAKVASFASRSAMATYSLPLWTMVCVTRRLVKMLYDVRSPCLRPHSVTTGTPIARASSVPLTPL